MDDPSRRARPVGPPPPASRPDPAPGPGRNPGPASGGQPPGGYWGPDQRGYGPPPGPAHARVYRWSWSGRSFPWLAILLLVLGIGLLIELLIPDLTFASLVILAAGVAFGAAWLVGGIVGATVPALVLTAWGLSGIGSDLGILAGDGWSALFIGLALLAAWALARYQGARRQWALVVGAVLGLIGLADVSDALSADLDLVVVIPLAMIAVGIYLILRDRLPARG